jgi:hypothetical protein
MTDAHDYDGLGVQGHGAYWNSASIERVPDHAQLRSLLEELLAEHIRLQTCLAQSHELIERLLVDSENEEEAT